VLELACADSSRMAAAHALLAEAVQIGDHAPAAQPLVIDRV
jgi:hypothetical protein